MNVALVACCSDCRPVCDSTSFYLLTIGEASVGRVISPSLYRPLELALKTDYSELNCYFLVGLDTQAQLSCYKRFSIYYRNYSRSAKKAFSSWFLLSRIMIPSDCSSVSSWSSLLMLLLLLLAYLAAELLSWFFESELNMFSCCRAIRSGL